MGIGGSGTTSAATLAQQSPSERVLLSISATGFIAVWLRSRKPRLDGWWLLYYQVLLGSKKGATMATQCCGMSMADCHCDERWCSTHKEFGSLELDECYALADGQPCKYE